MGKSFISYCHVKPEEDFARFLKKFLEEHGHEVFIDTDVPVGTEWVREIQCQIKSSEFFIVLLSKKSIRSPMVREEVKQAHDLSRQRGDKFTILPIRIDFTGELPLDLGAYLDPIQYAQWKQDDAFGTTGRQILTAIEKQESLPLKAKEKTEYEEVSALEMQELFDATDGTGAPLPAADPRLIPRVEMDTGTVKLDSPFYVKRKADVELMEQIQEHGSTTIVKGPRQMGKSSLLARAHAEAKKFQLQSCYLDFQFLDNAHLANLDTLFQYLARKLCRTFKTALKPEDCWDDLLGAKENLTGFIKEALLEKAQLPVLILMDEVDRLFSQPFRDDFFAAIRGWHNLRATDESWNNLNLVIAHSTEPYLWIQDINQSPFNVGYYIKLEDFEFQQVKELNLKHGMPLKTDEEIQELLNLTGGQPYLVRLALYTMAANQLSFIQLMEISTEDSGPFGDHLRRFVWRLQGEKGLRESLYQVLRRGVCEFETHFLRLRSAGLVKGDSRDNVRMRCPLYEDYFRKHLVS